MIRFDDVTFGYGGAAVPAVRNLSFELPEGRSLVVLGANGSGKSTLARLCNGLLLPDSGTVTVDGNGTDVAGTEIEIRSRVGMVFQSPDDQIVATSVEDDVAFGPENLGLPRDELRRRVDEAIVAVGLTGLESREPHLLSGGQKQRLAIAGVLAMRPRYLVFDEPTSMIDAAGRREFSALMRTLREEHRGVLLVTHDVAEALDADDVLVLSRGEIVFRGAALELLGVSEELERWGLEIPPLQRLGHALQVEGVSVSGPVHSVDSLVDAVCR